MGAVVLDASVLIAYLNPEDAQHEAAGDLFESLTDNGAILLIPASVYAEILVAPIRAGKTDEIDDFLVATGARLIPIDRAVARAAASLRAVHMSLRLPDALCLATARVMGAQLLTFDQRLQKIADAQA